MEPASVKTEPGATPVLSIASGGGGGDIDCGVPGNVLAASNKLWEKSTEDAGVVRVEAPSEAGAHGGGAGLNGIGGAGRHGIGAGVEERRDTSAFTELGLGDLRGYSSSAGQILVTTDRACSKRPRKEEERGAR